MLRHHISSTHATRVATKVGQKNPSVAFPNEITGSDSVFFRVVSGIQVVVNLVTERHRMAVPVRNGPLGVANVVVEHHSVPFTSSHHLVVMVGETLIFFHEITDGETVANGGGVVDVCYTCTGHCRVIDQLIEGILSLGWNLFL